MFLDKHTLVKLSDGHDGYINASFIAGHNGPHEYIATLAPWNQDSIRNFYRLILEYHVVIIVNLVEFGKSLMNLIIDDYRFIILFHRKYSLSS